MQSIKKPIYQRQPCAYKEAWLQDYVPNVTFYLSREQRRKLKDKSIPLLKGMPAGTYARKIFNRLLINLSYNSSRLEGNTYSLLDTEKLLLEGRDPENKLDAEKLMILNHKEAIRFLVDGIHRLDINIDNIRTLHYLLSDGLVMQMEARHIREGGVRVSGTIYIPLERQDNLTYLLNTITEKASQINDPYEQSFFLLVHIAYLQAFADVNNPTSRLAANIPLVKHNLAPLSFNEVSKDDYIDAVILSYEANDARPLAELYVWSYLRSYNQYTATAEAIGIDVLNVRFRQFRKDGIAQIIRNKLISKAKEEFIQNLANQKIPKEYRDKFIQDLKKELESLEPFKISGMGITQKEFLEWKTLDVQ